MVSSGGNIKIKINGAIRDFDEVLEELHVVALERIHNGEQSNFGTTLLAILGGAQME
jgi:hypothetical protein